MIYNKNLVYSNTLNKIKDTTFNAFVTEAFISALPFDEDTFSRKQKATLSEFSFKTLESLGSYSLLENAIARESDLIKKRMLTDIASICTETAKKVADRVSSDVEEADDETNSKLVKNPKMNKDESEEFLEKVKNSDVSEISEEINKKVVEVIKDEKDAYKKEQELKDQLEDELKEDEPTTDTDDSDDGTVKTEELDQQADQDFGGNDDTEDKKRGISGIVESYLPYITERNDAKTHVSLFSTIQKACLEGLIFAKDNYKSFHPNLLTNIATEFYGVTPKVDDIEHLESLTATLENYSDTSQLGKNYMSKRKVLGKALENAICAYTFMETLNSMNLVKPNTMDVKKFIETKNSFSSSNEKSATEASSFVNKFLGDIESKIRISNNIDALEGYKAALEKCKATVCKEDAVVEPKKKDKAARGKKCPKCGSSECDGNCTETRIREAIEKCKNKINTVRSQYQVTPTEENDKCIESDIASVNKIANLLGRKPMVTKLSFRPVNESFVDVYALKYDGQVIGKSFMTVNKDYSSHNMSLESYLSNIVRSSKIPESAVEAEYKVSGERPVNLM